MPARNLVALLDEICTRHGVPDEDRLLLEQALGTPGDRTATATQPGAEGWTDDVAIVQARRRVLMLLGQGAMGEVRRVLDELLGRTVAEKVALSAAHAEALIREARVMARLQHPGVPPVHSLSWLADGRPAFTMKEVEGCSLAEALAGDPSDAAHRATATTRALISVVERLAWTITSAHEAGVVHGDVKPHNVMLGALGEVYLVDWGVAGEVGAPVRGGTRGFRAPEQCAGASLTPAMDVHAFGATLLRVLEDLDEHVVSLQGLAQRCVGLDPTLRPASMREVAVALVDWLDGADRAARARELLAEAELQRARLMDLRTSRGERQQDWQIALSTLAPSAPVSEKEGVWTLEDELSAARRAVTVAERGLEQTLRLALEVAPEHAEVRHALAEHYLERLAHLDSDDSVESEVLTPLVRTYGSPRQVARAGSGGRLTLLTRPSGARARVLRVVERRRRLVLEPHDELGPTPLVGVCLAAGSWVVELEGPGGERARVPVRIDRNGHWDNVMPGTSVPHPVTLLPAGALGPDECHVPAGWARLGGDPDAPDAFPAAHVWVDAFVIRAGPVTVGEYRTFLADLPPADRGRHIPPLGPSSDDAENTPLFDADLRIREVRGQRWTDDLPMAHLSWHDAVAFAEWERARTGLPWRLPDGWEWEKAARGVDGRPLPWGSHFEPGWVCMAAHHAGPPRNAPVADFPLDIGVYGMRGACGHVRNWCRNRYARGGPPGQRPGPHGLLHGDDRWRVLRGGSAYASPSMCRPAGRYAAAPDTHPTSAGLRLARSL